MPSAVACSATCSTTARSSAASAAGVAAPNTKSSVSTARRRSAGAASPVYSSSAMWKLLPPKPNELTPARRGWASPRTQGRARVPRWNGLSSSASFGFGASTLMVGGSTRCCSAKIALMSPAAPAAALACPICDFTEPIAHHWRSSRPVSSKTVRSPSNSAASPAMVPVPCASTSSTLSGP